MKRRTKAKGRVAPLAPSPGASSEPPEVCDFVCPFADFPPADTAGICRTMSAVWCEKLKALVEKNQRCHWRSRQSAAAR